jgi:hypothetical protein
MKLIETSRLFIEGKNGITQKARSSLVEGARTVGMFFA